MKKFITEIYLSLTSHLKCLVGVTVRHAHVFKGIFVHCLHLTNCFSPTLQNCVALGSGRGSPGDCAVTHTVRCVRSCGGWVWLESPTQSLYQRTPAGIEVSANSVRYFWRDCFLMRFEFQFTEFRYTLYIALVQLSVVFSCGYFCK